ncbi:hypothetical protein NDU88_003449 [Pleurodeles waltl]|uniref:Uncharacterized protein n=1 Tax=Pleurodeles waltl TaxID=8319 RepID=A0AAV7WP37_PLEWA|nr:hypothetical protein NDU88_003449 [Pleurodeles waltl]
MRQLLLPTPIANYLGEGFFRTFSVSLVFFPTVQTARLRRRGGCFEFRVREGTEEMLRTSLSAGLVSGGTGMPRFDAVALPPVVLGSWRSCKEELRSWRS